MIKNPTLLSAIFLMCLGTILTGFSGAFVRFSDLGPLTTAFYRMIFSLPLLALWMRWENTTHAPLFSPRLTFKEVGGILLTGALFAVDLGLWNWSIGHTTIVNSSFFNSTAAFYVPLIMWLFFKKKPSSKIFIAAGIGFIGCAFLVGESLSMNYAYLLGDLVALLSGLMVALYLITVENIRHRFSTGALMFWTGCCTAACLCFFSYLAGESLWPLTLRDVGSILGQAVLIHVLGQGLIAYSLGKIPATYAAIILFLAPVTGAFLGWFVYGESLGVLKVIGMFLIMTSILSVRKKSYSQ